MSYKHWGVMVAGLLVGCSTTPTAPEITELDLHEDEVNELNAKISEQAHQIESLTAKLEGLVAQLQSQNNPKATAQQSVMALYRKAQKSHRERKYKESKNALEGFLALAPDHPYADRMAYLNIQILFEQRNYPRVLVESDRFEKTHPYSFKLPGVIYTKALTLVKLERRDEAMGQFVRLMKRFPDVNEAQAAAHQIAQLQPLVEDSEESAL